MAKYPYLSTRIWTNPIHILAFGFGAGLFPRAPGTFGTLMAIPFFWLLSHLSLPYYLITVFILGVISCWICHVTSKDLGVHDYKGIVLDEMVGYWVAMASFPATLPWMILGFLFFRLFDIWKPWPISVIQEKVKGGFGIVFDDVVAALFAWIALFLIHKLFPFL